MCNVASRHADLVDPALPWSRRGPFTAPMYALLAALLAPGPGDRALYARMRRLGPERAVNTALRIVCAHPDRLPDHMVRANVERSAAG